MPRSQLPPDVPSETAHLEKKALQSYSSQIDSLTVALNQAAGTSSDPQTLREKMMEIQIEKDEQQKALEMLQQVRKRERDELMRQVEEVKAQGGTYAESVKNEMASRIEKQVQMIEALLEDKKNLQEHCEAVTEKAKDIQHTSDKQMKALEDRL